MRISAYNESGNNIVISDNTEETLNQLTMTLRGLTSTVKGLNNTIMAAMGKVVDTFCYLQVDPCGRGKVFVDIKFTVQFQ